MGAACRFSHEEGQKSFTVAIPDGVDIGKLIGRSGSNIEPFKSRMCCQANVPKGERVIVIIPKDGFAGKEQVEEELNRMFWDTGGGGGGGGGGEAVVARVRSLFVDPQCPDRGTVEWQTSADGCAYSCKLSQDGLMRFRAEDMVPLLRNINIGNHDRLEAQFRFGLISFPKNPGLVDVASLRWSVGNLSPSFKPQIPVFWDPHRLCSQIPGLRLVGEASFLSVELTQGRKHKIKLVFSFEDDVQGLTLISARHKVDPILTMDWLHASGLGIRLQVVDKPECTSVQLLKQVNEFAAASSIRKGIFSAPAKHPFDPPSHVRSKTRVNYECDGIFLQLSCVTSMKAGTFVPDEVEVEMSSPAMGEQLHNCDHVIWKRAFTLAWLWATHVSAQIERDKARVGFVDCPVCLQKVDKIFCCGGREQHPLCTNCVETEILSALHYGRPVAANGCLRCKCGGEYPLHEIHRCMKPETFQKWLQRREDQVQHEAQAVIRREREQTTASLVTIDASTKKCPTCFLPWSDPIRCSHVTCDRVLTVFFFM